MIKYAISLLLATSALGAGFSSSLAFRGQAGGESLLNSLVSAWQFDEHQDSGSRTDAFAGFILLDQIGGPNLVGSMRGIMGGATSYTNGSSFLTNIINQSSFQAGSGKSFTMAAWIEGGNAGNSRIGSIKFNGGFDYDWEITGVGLSVQGNLGTPYAINWPYSITNNYALAVVGFDAPTKTLFLSLNGSTKSTTVFSGDTFIRNSNFPFMVEWLNGAVDELYFWNRTLTQAEITRLYNSGYGLKYPFNNIDGVLNLTLSYLWSLTNRNTYTINGSNATYTLIKGYTDSGIWDKLNLIVGYTPDSLKVALTPIKTIRSEFFGNDQIGELFDPYQSLVGFVDNDIQQGYSGGLKGVAAAATVGSGSKYFPVNSPNQVDGASIAWPNINDGGYSILVNTTNLQPFSGHEFGMRDDGVSPIIGAEFMMNSSNDNRIRAYFGDRAAELSTNSTPGFYSINRDSSSSLSMFFGNDSIPFGLYASTNYADVATTFRSFHVLGGGYAYLVAGVGEYVPAATSSNLIGYLSLHTHLTQADASNEWYFSTQFRLKANPFSSSPVNTQVVIGNNATMNGTLDSRISASPAYQWSKNGVNIVGATQSSYTVNNAALSDFDNAYQLNATVSGVVYHSLPAQLATVTTATVSNWVNMAYLNGSTLVSSNTIWGVDQFWNGMITDGIDTDMYSVNCYVPDNLIACLTPLVNIGGPNMWVNNGPFVSANLTVNGLISDGTKYLDTGIKDSTTFSSVNDIGFTIYFSATPSDTGLTGIITPDDQGGYMLQANRSGSASWFDYGPASGGAGNLHATSPGPGYYCGVRTASNAEAFYFASSGSAHAALATGSTAPTEALVGINVYIFNCNGLSVPTTNKRISYTSISKGLTSTKSSHQYSRVQTLRTTLGGGFQ